ncbi:unnamed protein product [Rhizoctonia solani]|uniref:Uncharacterized protein n=1 Tax=Rhizoctonia solani TaxID=456999 RepID=A0A8H3AUD1_9AGAM|nr:unnamed protein product [Rhizoctonia solani]
MLLSKLRKLAPDWATRAASRPRNWKIFLRCWVTTWVCFILILPSKTLETMGSACFFACMACFLLPPNVAFQVYLFSIIVLLLGCLVGWAFGSIAMVVAFAARDKVSLESAVLRAQASAANEPDPVTSFQKMVFRGDFLGTRSTAIFGTFLGIGTFAFTVFRVRVPNAVFAGIFGNVFLDVICTFGPLLPTPQYLTMKTFLVSTCVYVAVSLVCIILIFPETLNHEWLNSYTEVLDMVKILVDMQEVVLGQTVDQLASARGVLAKINGIQDGALAMLQGFTMNSSMLNLEFSYGRWSGADVETLEMPLKVIITKARGMSAFATQYCEYMNTLADRLPSVSTDSTVAVQDKDDREKPSKDQRLDFRVQATQRILQIRRKIAVLEQAQDTRVETIVPLIRDSTSQLRTALSKALGSTSKAIQDVNSRRYKPIQPESLEHLQASRDSLNSALSTYKESGRLDIFEPLTKALDTASGRVFDQHGDPLISLRPLFMSSVFESNLCWTANGVLTLMDLVVKLMEARPRNRLWAPTQLRKLASVLFRGQGPSVIRDVYSVPKPSKEDEYLQTFHRDPDARSPQGFGQKLSHVIRVAWRYLNTDEAIFGFKCTVVTLALWFPQVIKSSAEFTYNERGLWAMIMAQFGVEMYMSDHIGGFVVRTAGTVAGGLIGTTLWYIGAGSGPGNPYGLAGAFGVCVTPLVFFRLFWYEQIAATIITSVTIIMMVGFSWVNTHLTSLNVVYGYEIFWRRTLLVLVGFAASFIVMFFPPQSARKAVRLDNAASISEISQIYGILVSSWLTVEEDSKEKPSSDTDSEMVPYTYDRWTPAFRTKCMALWTILYGQKRHLRNIKWERSIRGKWPGEHYERLIEIQNSMLSNLIQLAGSLSDLPPTWRKRLLRRTIFLHPNLISDVMAVFDIISMSLRTGQPIHEVLSSNLLDRAFYHSERGSRVQTANIISSGIIDESITGEIVRSPEYSTFAAGVSAAIHILSSLDEVQLITKDLCGVIPLKGYTQWREQHELGQLRSVV